MTHPIEGCFQPVSSADILDEAICNLLVDGRITTEGALGLRRDLDLQFEDALVHDYRPLIPNMPNHPKDRHVAACATAGGASLIVTSNVRDFAHLPAEITRLGITLRRKRGHAS